MKPINHVAIIMDGNGRWAIKRNKPRNYGHQQGIKNIKKIIEFCKSKKISFLTLFVFSLDNWKRSSDEVLFLFKLLENYININFNYLKKNHIKLKILGENLKLKPNLLKKIKKINKLKLKNFEITVNLAFNYSAKAEIINSVNNILKKKNNKKIIKESDVEKYLYTYGTPDPEILIRTGGYTRLSNFLLWQISYSEIFFIKKFWPDFSINDLNLILKKYNKIKRNFGSIHE